MVNPRESHAAQDWASSDIDSDWDDDLIDIDELIGNEEYLDDLILDDSLGSAAGLAAWRRIEIARENKRLRAVLSEASDYENCEYLSDDELAEYSY